MNKYCTLNGSKIIWEIYKKNNNNVYLKNENKKILTSEENITILDDSAALEMLNLVPPLKGNITIISDTINSNTYYNNEIMLRHKTKINAINDLDKFIDSAILQKHQFIKIIHGKRGGIIRKAVHEYLDTCPYVVSYHYGEYHEGGFGVTIAKLF